MGRSLPLTKSQWYPFQQQFWTIKQVPSARCHLGSFCGEGAPSWQAQQPAEVRKRTTSRANHKIGGVTPSPQDQRSGPARQRSSKDGPLGRLEKKKKSGELATQRSVSNAPQKERFGEDAKPPDSAGGAVRDRASSKVSYRALECRL